MNAVVQPTLYDVVRYAKNVELMTEDGRLKFAPLVGEEAAFLTVFSGFAMARRGCTVLAFSGTGKTVLADAVWDLLPEDQKETVDMVSGKAIWHIAARLNEKAFLYFPEEQNAGDNDEVVKIKKKLGEGKPAVRETTGQRAGDLFTTATTRLDWKPDLSTMAIENSKADDVMDEESRRRRIIVTTDPTSRQTRNVLKAQARLFSRGKDRVRTMSPLDILRIKQHVAEAVNAYAKVDDVQFFGMEAFAESIPDKFTTARSAFPMLLHTAKGVGLFYHKTETIRGKTLILSPARFAETLEFYGPTFFSNCLKLPTLGRELLAVMPPLKRQDGMVQLDSMLNEGQILDALSAKGYSVEKKKARDILKKLVDTGYIAENKETDVAQFHRTALADFENNVDWRAILKATREVAKEELGAEADAWIKQHADGDTVSFVSPINGQNVTKGAA